MKIIPTFDRILVAPVPEGRVTKGGLVIPDVAAQSKAFAYGDVIAVGSGRVNLEGVVCPLSLKVGDTVMYLRRSGQPVPIPDEESGEEQEYLLMREPDILAVVSGLPRDSGIRGLDGRILAMMPSSSALPDQVYKNIAEADVAEREGWAAPGELVDDCPPGENRL